MRRKLQFATLFLETFLLRHKIPLVTAGLLGFIITILLFILSPYISLLITREQTIGIVGKVTDTTLPLSIQRRVSFGLTALTDQNVATASLSPSWTISDDGKEYLFRLQEGVFWHDGEEFTAADVNYRLKGAVFEVVDRYTLRVKLEEPFSPLPTILSQPLFRQNLLGVGTYRVIGILRDGEFITQLRLQSVDGTEPSLTYIFYPSETEAIIAFKLGEIKRIEHIQNVGDLASWEHLVITPVTQYDRFIGVFFNLTNELWREKELRQALAYATSKSEPFEQALSPISRNSWAYFPKVRIYNQERERAEKVITDSPLASDSAVLTLSTFAPFVEMAQHIVDEWKTFGINAKVKVENTITADFQVFLLSQSVPPDPDQYLFWQSTQTATNLTHYSSQKIDKLLEDGRKIHDPDRRKKIYEDFQRYLVDDAPVIFLYHPRVYVVERE